MKRGFTLIETLTVIMILLIVMAITYPVLFQARARAKQTVCESNLHQIYLGILLYEQDYEKLPFMESSIPAWYKRYSGGVRLRCPAANNLVSAWDYYIFAGPDPSIPDDSIWAKRWRECQETRGSDYPYAVDVNHSFESDAYQGNGRRFILVRASGAIANVPMKERRGSWMPCDRELPYVIQH